MLTIKNLGGRCPNCKKVEEISRRAAGGLRLEAEFIKVTHHSPITQYPILGTPGLVINEKVVCSGRIPSGAEVITWLANALADGG
jgi:hypothetical protein